MCTSFTKKEEGISFYCEWVLLFCFVSCIQVGCLVVVWVLADTDYGFVSGEEELGDRPVPLYYLKPMLECDPVDPKLCQSRLVTLVFGIVNTWTAMRVIYVLMVVMQFAYVLAFSVFYRKVMVNRREDINNMFEDKQVKDDKNKLYETEIMVIRAFDEAVFFNLTFHVLGMYMGRQEIYDILKSFTLLLAGDYLVLQRDFNAWSMKKDVRNKNKMTLARKKANELIASAGYSFYVTVVAQSLFGVANLGIAGTLPPSLVAYAAVQFTCMITLKTVNYFFHRFGWSLHRYNLFYAIVSPIMKALIVSMFIWNNSRYYAANVLVFS